MNQAALAFAAARALSDLDRGLMPANYVRRPWALVEPHRVGLLHLQQMYSELFRFGECPFGLLWTIDEPGDETAFFLTVWAHREAMETQLREQLTLPDAAEGLAGIQSLAVDLSSPRARQDAARTWLKDNEPTPAICDRLWWLRECAMRPRSETPWGAAARAARSLLDLTGGSS